MRMRGFAVASAVLATVLPFVPGGSAQAAGRLNCDSAVYPSTTWTACEAGNDGITTQNATDHVALMPALVAATLNYQMQRLATLMRDPERRPNPNPCSTVVLCPIDPRLQNWTSHGGIVDPVLYTSRSGATISGHVWATRIGPAKRPGVVFINGSVVGFEQIYWFIAQTLAREGFVVMTFDVQGEGMSDQFGQAPDQNEDALAGTPGLALLQSHAGTGDLLGGNGLPFYDGGEDALDFFLSTPTHPYVPTRSRTTGTSHEAKQARRVAAGLDNAYNPLWQMLDPKRIGLTGHSYGAQAASWLSQYDPRVSAAVAMDNLCVPVSPAPTEGLTSPNPDFGGVPDLIYGFARDCFSPPPGTAPAIRKPVLGISSDYLTGAPYLAPPTRISKERASLAWTAAGVDTGQIVIRGATHFDFNDVPAVLPASLRGIDVAAWYTTAWFAKYLQHDPAADRMLLTRRWLDDPVTAGIDPLGDPNLYSWHYASRLDIHLANGTRFDCENLRASCTGMTPQSQDGWLGSYSFASAAE